MRQAVAACLAGTLIWAGAAAAALADRAAQVEALLKALHITETVEIMQAEGQRYGADLAQDMIPDADPAAWAGVIDRIYDGDKMYALLEEQFTAALQDTDLDPILAYYQSAAGQEIVLRELSARRAFLDPVTEMEATEHYRARATEQSALLAQIDTMIDDSDLVELNVMGAMNSDLMFYRGLTDGGAYEMSEADMVADVWAQEEDVRQSSQDWLKAFLMTAYQPVEPARLEDYAAFYRTPEGRALNRAVFAAFDEMYEEISYLLGLAVAQHMQSEKL